MLHVTDVNIYSIDKSEDNWAIDGEIQFEDDLISAFEAGYLVDDDELEHFTLELEMEEPYDQRAVKDWIVKAANEFED